MLGLYHVLQSKAYQSVDERYKEKGGFVTYLKEQLSTGYRKAMYLIDCYISGNKFLKNPSEAMGLIGWTKMSKIVAVMNADNATELVDLAKEKSVYDLSEAITTSYKEVGGVAGERRKKITFKFRLWEDQATPPTSL